AVVSIAANIAYEDAQAAIDGKLEHPLTEAALRPLWGCWAALNKARDKREPLDLDLPERRIMLDEMGRILSVAPRERL
ncbi:ribonuclease R, partial [Escherichia coli]|nr:ribonuclease R [Escherichia coli]